MPSPRPTSRQFSLSEIDPCDRRGYQASGTETVRPSTKSTKSVSSLTATFWAAATRELSCEELIPRPQQIVCAIFNYTVESADFQAAESAAVLQPDRIKPELGPIVVSLHVNMRRLVSIG